MSEYPGLHPGTGFDDHLHVWLDYEWKTFQFRACQICGYPHPDDGLVMDGTVYIANEKATS